MTTEEFITRIAARLDKYDDPFIQYIDEGGYGSLIVEIEGGQTFMLTAFDEYVEEYSWVIIEDGGVTDRFATLEEANLNIATGGYGKDAYAEYQPESR